MEQVKDDHKQDHTKILKILLISYIFKTFRLVIIITQVSYYIGILFYIWIQLKEISQTRKTFSAFTKLRTPAFTERPSS